MGSFPVKAGQTFLCIGDSITDCGRRAQLAPFGDGYMSLFRELAIVRHPERNIRWINRGISGNRVSDLRNRWEDDVIREKPDWLSIKIGINDLHSHLGNGEKKDAPDAFRQNYTEILERTKDATKARIVLIEPFYLSKDVEGESQRTRVLRLLPEYLKVVRGMAAKYKALHVPTQQIFEVQMKHRAPNDFAPEPVHPYRLGHLVIAHALYETLCES